jgi:rubrerythrin
MNVRIFLAHSVQLEREAARRYEELSAAMGTEGNQDLKVFFARMAHYSRLHLAEAMARGGFREVPTMRPDEYTWPDGTSPETAGWIGVDAHMDRQAALELALDGERSGHAYYAGVAASTSDAELRSIAGEFAEEEADHVRQLEVLLAACGV